MDDKWVKDPNVKEADINDYDHFIDFLVQEIYNAKINMKMKHGRTIYNTQGDRITDRQVEVLKDIKYRRCFKKLPKEDWVIISRDIRWLIDVYNSDPTKKLGNIWKKYKKGQNERDIRNRVIRRIEALREEVESFEEYPDKWDREEKKNFEYYQLGSILDRFKETLTVDKYIPHFGMEGDPDPNIMWIPPFKYFKPKLENKDSLKWWFK